MPHNSKRARKDLPVPDWPKMPLERSINRCMCRQMGRSMVSGVPMEKWVLSSSPKTTRKSPWVAWRRVAKCMGMVRTGCGAVSMSTISPSCGFSIISMGLICTVA